MSNGCHCILKWTPKKKRNIHGTTRGTHQTRSGASYVQAKKAINGLKQSSHCWNKEFTKFLMDLGFKQSTLDPWVFVREEHISGRARRIQQLGNNNTSQAEESRLLDGEEMPGKLSHLQRL